MTGHFLFPRLVEFCLTISLTAVVITKIHRNRTQARFLMTKPTNSIPSKVAGPKSWLTNIISKVSSVFEVVFGAVH